MAKSLDIIGAEGGNRTRMGCEPRRILRAKRQERVIAGDRRKCSQSDAIAVARGIDLLGEHVETFLYLVTLPAAHRYAD
jgi:hypothetical protein